MAGRMAVVNQINDAVGVADLFVLHENYVLIGYLFLQSCFSQILVFDLEVTVLVILEFNAEFCQLLETAEYQLVRVVMSKKKWVLSGCQVVLMPAH